MPSALWQEQNAFKASKTTKKLREEILRFAQDFGRRLPLLHPNTPTPGALGTPFTHAS
jgi:hypothetical protein